MLVDRARGYVRLVQLPVDRTGMQVAAAVTAAVSADIPAHQRQTLTWDQGVEMARHDLIARLFSKGVFFAHPASPMAARRK